MELIDAPWCLYFPIDGDAGDDRLPPSWVEMLRQVDLPVAMSQYGRRVAGNCGVTCEYIPHGVDLATFCPPDDREAAKARLGYDGRFVVLSDSRNQPRKMLPRLLDVFARFAADRPDALLHLHTDVTDEFTRSVMNSYDVEQDVRHLGLASKVRFTPGFVMKHGGGLPLAELAAYYQAADVHLLASSGEGFGLPTLQAAAAGAVPMACAYSASHELTEGHGESLPIADWTETEFGIRRALIDVEEAAATLARYYDDRDLLRERSRASRRFAEPYAWPLVVDQWDAMLRSVARSRRRVKPAAESRFQPFETIAPRLAPKGSGISVSVKVIDREFGRLEASIIADARGHASDVRIPAAPPHCEVAKVLVPRRPGYVGLTTAEVAIFRRLRRIFPILHGWIPARGIGHDANEPGCRTCADDPRYELAQSILLIDLHDGLPESVLIDAALFGVPCLGGSGDLQQLFWPELIAESEDTAVAAARRLLTNAAEMRRVTVEARTLCVTHFAPDEQEAADTLRSLHAEQTLGAVPAGR
jgi:glycosyltransferase involved in cell wall biosynthesis